MGRRAATPHGPAAAQGASGLTLDAGALIALERSSPRLLALLDRLEAAGVLVAVPAGALAQAWRASPRQHALALLLDGEGVDIVALDMGQALAIGTLLAATATSDVVDASVAVTARERGH